MPSIGKRGIGVCAGLLGLVVAAVEPAVARADSPPCPAAVSTLLPAGTPLLDYAENLTYDQHGNLWVARLVRNQVQRYDSGGRLTGTVAVESPGAVRLGPDGLLYVVYGDSLTSRLPGARGGGVVRFDPDAAAPVPEEFVSGLGMPNGAAFDSAGNLYVADTANGVIRIRREGTPDSNWNAHAAIPGANGIVVAGDSIYVTEYSSLDGRVVRIPISDPARKQTAANVTMGASGLSALPDDLAVGPDGKLYDATTTGDLVRIDPAQHTTCTVYSGADPLTAVALAPDGSLSVSTIGGAVLRMIPG
ncbi:hypothetical protein NDR87_25490 [Nocardia sp. CDC159]|uniref:SMP-30/Gluconolactonase/LRE-like region domain-containing protein n=1 Tax=Nocardia pulmonis TaxID=2951408 RepID=A0A9X2E7U5_9NOCA|nr:MULTISPECIES: hypothetical protein [Nocardia]MCM6774798.1 hypothetical protein [Nocardia pulmonis]MCM6789729.1 hypothetical protein [Nocardia sp. CDC159]